MWSRFTEPAKQAIYDAQLAASQYSQQHVSSDHMLLGVLHSPRNSASSLIARLGVSRETLIADLCARQQRGEPVVGDHQLSQQGKDCIDCAYSVAKQLHHQSITPEHLLAGILMAAENRNDDRYQQAGLTLASVITQIGNVGEVVWPPPPTSNRTPATPVQSAAVNPAARIGLALAMISVGVSAQYVSSTPPSVPWRFTHPLLVACNIGALGFGWAARNSTERNLGRLAMVIAIVHTIMMEI